MCTNNNHNNTTSSTTGTGSAPDFQLSHDLRVVHAVCASALALLGTTGNLVSAYLICKEGLCTRSPAMMLILNLCLANLVSTTIALPMIALNTMSDGWIYGDIVCKLFGYVVYVAITAEVLILFNVTLSQYLIVVHHVTDRDILGRNRRRNLFLILIFPWVLGLAAYSLPLAQVWDEFGFEPYRGYCTLLNPDGLTGIRSVLAVLVIVMMVVECCYCYPAIFWVQYRSHRKTATSVLEAANTWRGRRRHAQVVKMIMAIIANFALTYVPLLVISVTDPCLERVSPTIFTVVLYVSWSHTASNPLIYALLHHRINALWRKHVLLSSCCRGGRGRGKKAVGAGLAVLENMTAAILKRRTPQPSGEDSNDVHTEMFAEEEEEETEREREREREREKKGRIIGVGEDKKERIFEGRAKGVGEMERMLGARGGKDEMDKILRGEGKGGEDKKERTLREEKEGGEGGDEKERILGGGVNEEEVEA
ncbi:allatostatin-A receptor [Aplysia californica]|uniref:Allatostatin-A receptor n=1 Tax=Aplysia californica TaxID=6500 RepID=A0ABM0JXA3_APLCA|nr:allatostatin-A receptor [Aplysia californica]